MNLVVLKDERLCTNSQQEGRTRLRNHDLPLEQRSADIPYLEDMLVDGHLAKVPAFGRDDATGRTLDAQCRAHNIFASILTERDDTSLWSETRWIESHLEFAGLAGSQRHSGLT